MKVLAIHLPAFHQIPENDEWWGEGFTEWNNVKSGVPLYKEHYQPLVPSEGYYDLSKKEDIIHQCELARQYNVYGFIFYHYWFDSERQLFQQPVDDILCDKNIDINYCFCWANETWITTWHGMDPKTLIKQEYGDEDDWKCHYDYLVKHFKDERYIKVDNKPMIYIYKINDIECYNEMFEYFKKRLTEDGFDGLYVVEYISSKNKDICSTHSSAVMEFEPLYTTYFDISCFNLIKRGICKKLKITDYQSYDKLWRYKLKRQRTYKGKNIQKSCFVDWDNSARKGRASMIVKGATPSKFKKYLSLLIEQNRKDCNGDFLVINAWNEWSEGAKLEPDTKFLYGYLEAVRDVMKDV